MYLHLDLYTGKITKLKDRAGNDEPIENWYKGLPKVEGELTTYVGEEYIIIELPIKLPDE